MNAERLLESIEKALGQAVARLQVKRDTASFSQGLELRLTVGENEPMDMIEMFEPPDSITVPLCFRQLQEVDDKANCEDVTLGVFLDALDEHLGRAAVTVFVVGGSEFVDEALRHIAGPDQLGDLAVELAVAVADPKYEGSTFESVPLRALFSAELLEKIKAEAVADSPK